MYVRLLTFGLLTSLVALDIVAQTPAGLRVTAAPESREISRTVYGRTPGIGAWNLYICNNEDVRLDADSVRVEESLASAGLRPINKESLMIHLNRARGERTASKVAGIIEWSTIGFTVFSAQAGLAVSALKYGAMTIPVAKRIADSARERVYVFDSSRLLSGPISLPPGACESRVLFSGVIKNARPLTVTVRGRNSAVVPGITSIPKSQ